MIKQRVITAAILIPITIAALYYLPPAAFSLLTALIALLGAWEWSQLMGLKAKQRWIYLVLVALLFVFVAFIPIPLILFSALAWWLLAATLVVSYPRCSKWWSRGWYWRGLMGFFVLVPCWTAINYIRSQDEGFCALLFLLVLIWGADSAAYFVGIKWGKHKLAPRVSPGKSIEGLLGALVFSILIAVIALWLCRMEFSLLPWGMALALVTVLFSVLGDLFESMLKRQAGVKDSGRLLPGHGGLLDRIDSLTAAAPMFALGAWLLGMYVSS